MSLRRRHHQAGAVVACVALLTGCMSAGARLASASPQELAQASNFHLCEASISMYASAQIDREIARRGLDCAPFAQAAIAQQQAKAARKQAALGLLQQQAIANQQRTVQPLPDVFPKRMNCTTLGDGVQCTQY